MAVLERMGGDRPGTAPSGERVVLEVETRVGRSDVCQLHLAESVVSNLHASFRWCGDHWVLKDLGSRNGTYVDGELLDPRRDFKLKTGAQVQFGSDKQTWRVVDLSPPVVMAKCLDEGYQRYVMPEMDILALPSSEQPLATIYRGPRRGDWIIEYAHERHSIFHHQQVVVGGFLFRFCSPDVQVGTARVEDEQSSEDVSLRSVKEVSLIFNVSRDEEHVELGCEVREQSVSLGSRAHFYLLLTLARFRVADEALGHSEQSAGWRHTADLCRSLRIPNEQLNVQIFRIRRDFGRAGFGDSAAIIERRPQAKQLRIAVPSERIKIQTI